MCTLRSQNTQRMGSCQNDASKTCRPARASMSIRENAIRWTLPCGKKVSRMSQHGTAPGDQVAQAGTLSVRRCRFSTSVRHSIFMVAAWISFFRTMKTRLPSHAAQREKNSHAIGSIMDLSRSIKRKCPSRSGTFSRSERFLRNLDCRQTSQAKPFDTFSSRPIITDHLSFLIRHCKKPRTP